MSEVAQQVVLIAPNDGVTIKMAAICTGLSEKAIRRKIEDGHWVEGQEYSRDPQGGIWINLKGVNKWAGVAAA